LSQLHGHLISLCQGKDPVEFDFHNCLALREIKVRSHLELPKPGGVLTPTFRALLVEAYDFARRQRPAVDSYIVNQALKRLRLLADCERHIP